MVSKKVQRKTWVEKKRKERRKRNEEEEKRKEAIREKVKKSRGAAERRRKAGEKWWEEVGKPKWQAECGERLRGHMALWAKGKEEDMRQEDMRKEKEVKASRMAAWVLEEAYCSGQRDGWRLLWGLHGCICLGWGLLGCSLIRWGRLYH
jgi:hypothetical protein